MSIRLEQQEVPQPLVLPLPPSVNHCYVDLRRGNRIVRALSNEAHAWKESASWTALQWARQTGWEQASQEPVALYIRLFWPDRRRHDADNMLKLLQDALKGIIVLDDDQIMPRVMAISIDKKHPRVELLPVIETQPRRWPF